MAFCEEEQKDDRHTLCYMENGRIHDKGGRVLEGPAIIIDKECGTFLKFGERDELQTEYEKIKEAMDEISPGCIAMLDFTGEDERACYVAKRMFASTAFCEEYAKHLKSRYDYDEWLKEEMATVPVNMEREG